MNYFSNAISFLHKTNQKSVQLPSVLVSVQKLAHQMLIALQTISVVAMDVAIPVWNLSVSLI